MFKLLLAVLLFLVASPTLNAERLIGHDFLALSQQNFAYKKAAQVISNDTPLGVLDFTFGRSLAPFIYVVANTSPSHARVHLLDVVCVRNGNCGPYSVVRGYTIASLDAAIRARNETILSHVRRRTNLYKAIALDAPSTTFLISPALEHNLSKKAWRVLADTVLAEWDVQLVNNGMGGVDVERYRGAWLEDHGKTPRADADITSLDGTEMTDINIDTWLNRTRNNRITFRWTRSYNCRNNGSWQDPRIRNSCPKSNQWAEFHHITDTLPAPLPYVGSVCTNLRPFASPSINKPLADDHGTGDPRANYPVLIADLGSADVRLITRDDTTVATYGHYGRFENGPMQRYYSKQPPGQGLGGYQVQQLAAARGDPYVYARRGGKCFGPFIAGRRQGTYR